MPETDLERTIADRLTRLGLTLAVAESCTGGLIAHRLTSIPGASNFFDRGFITYSNASKKELLGISDDILATHGAVSQECAEAMARGARERAQTSIAISVTGIAGPTGGSEHKPVGVVWIGYCDGKKTFAKEFHFADNRERTIERAAQAALNLLREELLRLNP